jgi:DNA-binding response OmpR family regulator
MARILCVEDDADLLKLYGKVICGFGHEVVMASNVADGMDHLEERDLQVLITDWSLGKDDAAPLISSARKKKIPVMVISGSADGFAESFCKQADLYLQKPIGANEFFGFIRELLVAAPLAG